jgi:hypothetical protein
MAENEMRIPVDFSATTEKQVPVRVEPDKPAELDEASQAWGRAMEADHGALAAAMSEGNIAPIDHFEIEPDREAIANDVKEELDEYLRVCGNPANPGFAEMKAAVQATIRELRHLGLPFGAGQADQTERKAHFQELAAKKADLALIEMAYRANPKTEFVDPHWYFWGLFANLPAADYWSAALKRDDQRPPIDKPNLHNLQKLIHLAKLLGVDPGFKDEKTGTSRPSETMLSTDLTLLALTLRLGIHQARPYQLPELARIPVPTKIIDRNITMIPKNFNDHAVG